MLVNGGFLFGMVFFVIWMGVMWFGNLIYLLIGFMFWVVFGGLVIEIILFGLMWKLSCDDLNVCGVFWYVI